MDKERRCPETTYKALVKLRAPLQKQSLAMYEKMMALTVQFLQHKTQYHAGVVVNVSERREDDEDIDARAKLVRESPRMARAGWLTGENKSTCCSVR